VPEQAGAFRMVWAAMSGALLDELRVAALVPTAAEPASEDDLADVPGFALLTLSTDKVARFEAYSAIVAAQVDCILTKAESTPDNVVAVTPPDAPPEAGPSQPLTRAERQAARRARRLATQQT
jgi:hypothetical protein